MANPLYPGYYPGKPVYRDRRPWQKPEDVPIGGFEESVDAAAEAVENSPIFFPKWLIEQEKADIKQALKITNYSSEVMEDIEVDYGVEELQDAPGGAGSIIIDPLKIAEDPANALYEGLIKGPIQSIIDEDDLQAQARAQIVKELVSNKDSKLSLAVEGAEKPIAGVPTVPTLETASGMGKNYGDVGKAAMEFAGGSSSVFTRNKTHAELNIKTLSSIASEFEARDDAGQLDASRLGASTAALVNEGKNIVVTRSAITSSLKTVQKKFKPVADGFDKGFLSPLGGSPEAELTELRSAISNARDALTDSRLSDSDRRISAKALAHIDKIENGISRFTDATGKITDKKGLEKFLRVEGQAFYRNDFDRGIAGSVTAKFASDTATNKKVLAALDAKDSSGKRVFSKASVNSLHLSRQLQTDWDYETLDDLITSIKDGKIPTQFLWRRVIKPNIETYTPSYWIGRAKEAFLDSKLGAPVKELLGKYTLLLNKVQNNVVLKYFGFLGGKGYEQLKRKIANIISEAITKAIDLATEGIGLIFDRIIKVVVRFIVEKTMDFAAKVGKAFLKLDPDAIEELFVGAGKALMPVAVGCLSPFVVVIVIVFFLLMMFVGVLPREDATKEYAPIGERIDVLLPWFGGFNAQDCSLDDVLSLPYENDTSNVPAAEAYDLVTELKRGFWCYWNHHPEYDDSADRIDLWDEIMFEFNAFPAALNECADCLFWCTWLPYVAYQNVGMEFDPSISYLGAQRMNDWFRDTPALTYITPETACGSGGVESGDIVFWNVAAGSGWHVSMVYKVEDGVIHTIHSNAPYKNLPLLCSGSAAGDPPGGTMSVVGFGRP